MKHDAFQGDRDTHPTVEMAQQDFRGDDNQDLIEQSRAKAAQVEQSLNNNLDQLEANKKSFEEARNDAVQAKFRSNAFQSEAKILKTNEFKKYWKTVMIIVGVIAVVVVIVVVGVVVKEKS